ncbi:signal peptide peptidase SppA [Reinekea blandensis]|uniref:Signal peptide peptidase SppA, 36K type n=1 Tax=Reinekea blandensis MED297 TaxID=314283 RepID=A4BE01_9GAMM|nr:signal peptide peptidase SppA [Reinekea blandensis]EAR09760.1 signal peptide peptidase SppA, 36K type [Reinekea blandensis MED297]
MFGSKKDETAGLSGVGNPEKEWRLIERVVMANTLELRKTRRWGIFFKILTFTYLFVLLGYVMFNTSATQDIGPTGGHTAVIDVSGVIAQGNLAGADSVVASLRRAVEHSDTRAVILRINSPGGSPVQSAYIYNEINRLRQKYEDIPIYSVIVDSGASGAYYIASATQEIYANGASLVGSIGVTAAGFGFQDLIEKVGIERRQFTSGEHKAFLDPFMEVDPEEQALFEAVLNDVHEQFIRDVQAGRGDRLADNDDLFSGLFWTGSQALDLGLVDGLKSTSELARDIGYPKTVDFTYHPSPLEQFARNLGVSMTKTLVSLANSGSLSLN